MAEASDNIDLAAAVALIGIFASAILAFLIASLVWGRREHARLARETGLPLVGKIPMEAVYAAIMPVGRGLARLGVPANAVSIASLLFAGGAGVLFAMGHFGVGTVVAVVATLSDALDGIVARESRTSNRFGQVLDTTIDRYVDALLIGGIMVLVRADVLLLCVTLAALVGGFMVSYASSVLRELEVDDTGAPMRRGHRVAYLLVATSLTPFVELSFPNGLLAVRLFPIVVALVAIALVGNVSAIVRLLRAARTAAIAHASGPVSSRASKTPLIDHATPRIDSVVTRERLP